MKLNIRNEIKPGSVLSYSDGRDGHNGVKCQVLWTSEKGIQVQFEDRADTTFIMWNCPQWLDYMTLIG